MCASIVENVLFVFQRTGRIHREAYTRFGPSSQRFRFRLSKSKKAMLDGGAVENRALYSFPRPLWTRSLRPQGRQRPHRLRRS
jgi:hypothetical protein